MPLPFRRVLVANRGEIAVRVIRACREAGLETVAVYSEADAGAPHTRLADEARPLGPAPAAESYLSIERLLAVARRSGVDAVHPGYGFLSERAEFAEACGALGLTWIGPPPSAMRLLGDKAAARRIAQSVGVPTVPGYDGADQDDETLAREARRIGFPLMIKAAAGGGGRGMRVVASSDDLPAALASARREARAAFGDGALVLERLLTHAAHFEVQVVADAHGAVVHLGERDCSVQRRHQKVVEECPAPGVSPELRAALGDAAVRVARAAGYANVGTAEFLYDPNGVYWFIEMNARLQVEHPVTEAVTGIDLVRLQLHIAAGEPLPFAQEDVTWRGHAVECRVYAEDPARDFLPSTGTLRRFALPLGPGLRHDVGVAAGGSVTPHYDAMLGKLIAWGEDRAQAVARARAALDEYRVEGVATNLPLLRWVLDHPTFRSGAATTDFLEREWVAPAPEDVPPEALAAVAAFELSATPRAPDVSEDDVWRRIGPWRVAGQGIPLAYVAGGRRHEALASRRPGDGRWDVRVGEAAFVARAEGDAVQVASGAGAESDEDDGGSDAGAPPASEARVARVADGWRVAIGRAEHDIRRAPAPSADAASGSGHGDRAGSDRLAAPMPGRVVRLGAAVGERVRAGQPLVVLEAMKIEHAVAAPREAVVAAVHCRVGEAVEGGALLVELRDDAGDAGG